MAAWQDCNGGVIPLVFWAKVGIRPYSLRRGWPCARVQASAERKKGRGMSNHKAIRWEFSGALLAAGLFLSGCVGGNTYGTGVSQEEQTFKDFYNMFTLNHERKNIDYSARPNLIVPENKAALPQPLDNGTATNDPAWPETPEQRIARIRAEAGQTDARTGDVSVEEQLRKKEGIAVEQTDAEKKFIPGRTDRDGNPVLYNGNSEARKEVLQAKADAELSHGPTRKYLTEPPEEYRIPAESAPTGDKSYTAAELERREAEKKKLREEQINRLSEHN